MFLHDDDDNRPQKCVTHTADKGKRKGKLSVLWAKVFWMVMFIFTQPCITCLFIHDCCPNKKKREETSKHAAKISLTTNFCWACENIFSTWRIIYFLVACNWYSFVLYKIYTGPPTSLDNRLTLVWLLILIFFILRSSSMMWQRFSPGTKNQTNSGQILTIIRAKEATFDNAIPHFTHIEM